MSDRRTADDFWTGKRVLVTGGTGFVGSYVVRALLDKGAVVTTTAFSNTTVPGIDLLRQPVTVIEADLREPHDCERIAAGQEIILNIAHADGSMMFKRKRPAYLFRQNMLITLNMLEAACRNGVQCFLLTSSSEVYPMDAPAPIAESESFRGLADRPTDGYSWSKRMSELAAQLFAHEYGIRVAIARPANVYGPGDDLDPARGRVIPTFIRNVFEGQPIVIWGDGEQVRSFLYVEDLARGMLDLAEKHAVCSPVNFSGEAISVRALAEMVMRIAGKKVEIRCERDKPAGAAMRVMDSSKAERVLGFRPTVTLEEGLTRTIAAYEAARAEHGTANV
jgi:nucleoside-diphosphate-sugar epimerase